jgi:hypothetical protein
MNHNFQVGDKGTAMCLRDGLTTVTFKLLKDSPAYVSAGKESGAGDNKGGEQIVAICDKCGGRAGGHLPDELGELRNKTGQGMAGLGMAGLGMAGQGGGEDPINNEHLNQREAEGNDDGNASTSVGSQEASGEAPLGRFTSNNAVARKSYLHETIHSERHVGRNVLFFGFGVIICAMAFMGYMILHPQHHRHGYGRLSSYNHVGEAMKDLSARKDVTHTTDNGWTVFKGPSESESWSFAPANDPAAPAVIGRAFVKHGDQSSLESRFLCEGKPDACISLFEEYQKLTAVQNKIEAALDERERKKH